MLDREILFRGKRLDNGEWVEGYHVAHAGCCHFIIPAPFGGYIAQDGTFYAPVAYMVDPSTVSRYTGLTDKHGARIFEGDIVRVKYDENGVEREETITVSWSSQEASFSPWNWGYICDGCDCACEITSIEIIGNRWDNPELMPPPPGEEDAK